MAADDAAVTVTLRANLKDYEAAMKQAVRITEKAAAAAEKAVSGIGKPSGGGKGFTAINDNFKKSSSQLQSDARILQYQLNDIFSGLASGQGIRAVQQQLGQIAQQLGGGGLAQGARTLGTAMIGMINPINLAAVAFGVLATVAASYFESNQDKAERLAKELKKHSDELDAIKQKWGAALPGLAAYVDKMNELVEATEKLAARQKLAAEAVEDVAKEAAPLAVDITDVTDQMQRLFGDEALSKINKMQDAFAKWRAEVDHGRPGLEQLQALHDELVATGIPAAVKLGEAIQLYIDGPIQHAIDKTKELNEAWGDMTPPPFLSGIGSPGMAGPGILGPQMLRKQMRSGTYNENLRFLKTRAASAEIAAQLDAYGEDTIKAFAELFAILPESARITSAARTFEKQAQLRREYLSGKGGLAAPPETGLHVAGAGRTPFAMDIGAGVDMETLRQAVAQVEKLEQLKGRAYEIDKVHVQVAGTQRKLNEEAAQAAERQAEQQIEATENLSDYLSKLDEQASLQVRINQINTDSNLTADQKAIAIEVETELQNALNLAKQNNITLSEQEIDAVRRLAVQNAQVKLAQDAITEAEKRSAKARQDQLAATKQLNDQMAGIVGGALSGFVNDLMAGEDAGDAFTNMLRRMATQIADMVIQMLIIKPLMNSLFGGTGGGLGMPIGHGGGSVSHLAGGRQRQASPLMFAGAPRYASGGVVGLKPGEVPIIAHRGEIIVPNARRLASTSASGRSGGDTNITDNSRIRIDMGTGIVAADTASAKEFGENVKKLIQQEMVREARPGGLLRRVQ